MPSVGSARAMPTTTPWRSASIALFKAEVIKRRGSWRGAVASRVRGPPSGWTGRTTAACTARPTTSRRRSMSSCGGNGSERSPEMRRSPDFPPRWLGGRMAAERHTQGSSTASSILDSARSSRGHYSKRQDLRKNLGQYKVGMGPLDRTQPILPMRPGLPERRTHDYERHGTTTLFAALDLASGKVMEQTHRRHRAAEFKKFLEHVDQQVPAELSVHLVLDNYSTHKTPEIEMAAPTPSLRTPLHAHLLVVDESHRALVRRKQHEKWIRRGTHRSVRELETSIREWIRIWNADANLIMATTTGSSAACSSGGFVQRVSGGGGGGRGGGSREEGGEGG